MDEHIEPRDHETVERLRGLGRHPVDPATASAHLTAMATAGPRRSPWRTKVAVAGAFLAGLLLGGTGLATAGALPDSAQEVAYSVLGRVGVRVAHPHEGNLCKGPPLWVLERRAPEANEEAAHEQFRAESCPQRAEGRQGPPDHVRSGEHRGGPPAHARGPAGRPGVDADGPGRGGRARAEGCSRPPPWAGPPEWAGEDAEPAPDDPRRQAREQLRVQWRLDCGHPIDADEE